MRLLIVLALLLFAGQTAEAQGAVNCVTTTTLTGSITQCVTNPPVIITAPEPLRPRPLTPSPVEPWAPVEFGTPRRDTLP